jgi:hypothetical protein
MRERSWGNPIYQFGKMQGRKMMTELKKFFSFAGALIFSASIAFGAAGSGAGVIFSNGSSVRITIETSWTENQWTPVIVSLEGAEIPCWMNGEGQVYARPNPQKASEREILFCLDLGTEKLQLGEKTLALKVYERNEIRTRAMLAQVRIALPVRRQADSRRFILFFGNLRLPVEFSAREDGRNRRITHRFMHRDARTIGSDVVLKLDSRRWLEKEK